MPLTTGEGGGRNDSSPPLALSFATASHGQAPSRPTSRRGRIVHPALSGPANVCAWPLPEGAWPRRTRPGSTCRRDLEGAWRPRWPLHAPGPAGHPVERGPRPIHYDQRPPGNASTPASDSLSAFPSHVRPQARGRVVRREEPKRKTAASRHPHKVAQLRRDSLGQRIGRARAIEAAKITQLGHVPIGGISAPTPSCPSILAATRRRRPGPSSAPQHPSRAITLEQRPPPLDRPAWP